MTFENPGTNLVEHGVQIGPDATIEPGVVLRGCTQIGANTVVGAHSVLIDSEVGDQVTLKPHSVLEQARVATGAHVGPFARLRPQSDIQQGAKVGNFVEIKKATLGPGAKVSHLSYIGDARIGAGANVGAGTITCNYDGYFKHQTDIGAGAFIGSNTALVAPVSIGDGAMVGAGSTITKDVDAGALAVARGRQTARPGWATLFREVKAAEKAAADRDPSSS